MGRWEGGRPAGGQAAPEIAEDFVLLLFALLGGPRALLAHFYAHFLRYLLLHTHNYVAVMLYDAW